MTCCPARDTIPCPALAARACTVTRARATPASCGVYPDDTPFPNGVDRTFFFYACLTPPERLPLAKAPAGTTPWCDVSGIWGELMCLQLAPQGGTWTGLLVDIRPLKFTLCKPFAPGLLQGCQ